MKFNGIDPVTLHPAISIAKEIPPGMAEREHYTVRGNGAERYAGSVAQRGEYIVRFNIAGKTPDQAWEVREILAGWASGGGRHGVCELVPTHRSGVHYDAVCQSIEPPEFKPRFAVVEAIFLLPDPRAIQNWEKSTTQMFFYSEGSSDPMVRIEHTQQGSAPRLLWQVNGKPLLMIDGTIEDGQTIAADFENGSVTIDGVHAEARVNPAHTRWRPGFTGGRNEITMETGGSTTIYWRDRWV